MTRGFAAFARQAVLTAGAATLALFGLAGPSGEASAQTSAASDGRTIIVGDVASSGFAIRFRCAGVNKEVHLLSNRDLQNAYGRALGGGGGGRVARVRFEADGGGAATVDLQNAGAPETISNATAFVYVIDGDQRAFADMAVSGRVVTVDRFDGRVLTDGLSGALSRQNAICPF